MPVLIKRRYFMFYFLKMLVGLSLWLILLCEKSWKQWPRASLSLFLRKSRVSNFLFIINLSIPITLWVVILCAKSINLHLFCLLTAT